MSKSWTRRVQAAFGALTVVSLLLSACAPAATPTVAPTPAATEVPAEEIHLEMLWWGCQNTPAFEGYLDDSIAKYEELHPNITITHICQGTDETLPAFQAALAAGEGADIVTEWYGLYMMPDVWNGAFLPLNDYVSEEELSHWTGAWQHYWNGNYYAVTLIGETHPVVYNKKYFAQAGLDPEKPPETWEEFLAACEALKNAGIEPLVIGLKDGWIVPVLMIVFGYQDLEDGPLGYMAAIAGEHSFTEPEFVSFWERLYDLKQGGYVNEDANSLATWEGRQAFGAERGALNIPVSEMALVWYEELGSDVVGLMKPPTTGIPMPLDVTYQTVSIPVFAAHPQEAADFLVYLRSPERLKALNDQIGYVFIPDDRFDTDAPTDPLIRQTFEWQVEANEMRSMGADGMIPYIVLAEGFFPAAQLMFAEDLKPDEAAAMVEEAAENWRQANPEMLVHYREWFDGIEASR